MEKTINVNFEEIIAERYLDEIDLELEYKRLDCNNDVLVEEASRCLAETFAGITVKGAIISEPMVQAVGLSVADFTIFVHEYIMNVVHQGFCYIAVEKRDKKVIGVLACEDFDPTEEIPLFTDNLEPMNIICELLDDLDKRFLDTLYNKTNILIEKSQLVHMFMIGVKSDILKKEIAKDLVSICQKDAVARGYKGMFLEATNIKSANLISKYFDFNLVNDDNGMPILTKYAESDTFKSVPPDVSEDCRIFYKSLDPEYDI